MVYGFAFLALGIVALLQARDPRGFPGSQHLWLLGLFGLVHGMRELLDGWILAAPAVDGVVLRVAAALLILSYVMFFEFGRRVARDAFAARQPALRMALGPWLTVAAVWAAVLLALWSGQTVIAAEAGARYFLCFPGGLLAGAALAKLAPGDNRAVVVLGLMLGLYALAGGLIASPVPGMPVWLPDTEVFNAVFGMPVQVIRALLALGALVAMAYAVRNAAQAAVDAARMRADELARLAQSLEDKIAERTSELSLSEQRLNEAERIAGLGYYIRYLDGRFTASDGCLAVSGLSRGEIGGSAADLSAFIHPGDLGKVREATSQVLSGHGAVTLSHRAYHKDGSLRHLRQRIEPYYEEGELVGLRGITHDITDQVELEGQLAQAQKMEAVGKLTGGLAHDLNNTLAVILGNAELLAEDLEGKGIGSDFTRPIIDASRRGGELISRLLAFARQQPLHPRATDVGQLTEDLRGMLERTLSAGIEIRTGVQPGTPKALADPAQVESALLNLALNARDAMPGGGRLSIEVGLEHLGPEHAAADPEVVPGDYVCLAVSDDGEGMDPETVARAFEPFFTTKGVGEGSGLGLSMVYGFAKQSGGLATITSEEGEGTTVRLYLPVAAEEPAEEPAPVRRASGGTGQRILLVEDDPDVSQMACRLLEGLGYEVSAAETAAQARALLASGVLPDMVLSDIVLPGGENGVQLGAWLRKTYPGLPVLYTSGYPDEAARTFARPGVEFELLGKPFRKADLAEAVERMLARGA